MSELVFSNAKIVLSDEVLQGSVKIEAGKIASIDSGSTRSADVDFEGDYLIPGLVELHTDNLERHVMPRPKSFWPTKSAVINHDREVTAAGITTVFDALSVGYSDGRARSERNILELSEAVSELNARGSLTANHFIHWRCEVSGDNTFQEAEELSANPLTGLYSVMDHTPGQRQFVSLDAYYVYFQGKYGLNDSEMDTFLAERREAQERNSIPNRRKIVELAHQQKVPLASHDDATEAHVAEAVDDGIVVAEFPTTLEAAKASHDNNMAVLMGSPNVVRGKSHSGNVSARDLAKEGVLDILSSDYVPFSLLYGATLLESLSENISLPEAIALVTKNPAEQVGLTDRGEIAIGKRGDFVRFRMDEDVPNIFGVWNSGNRVG